MHRHTHGSMHTQIHTWTARQNHQKPKERNAGANRHCKANGHSRYLPTILLRKTRESKPSSQQLTRLSPKLATYPVTKQKERLYPFRVRWEDKNWSTEEGKQSKMPVSKMNVWEIGKVTLTMRTDMREQRAQKLACLRLNRGQDRLKWPGHRFFEEGGQERTLFGKLFDN